MHGSLRWMTLSAVALAASATGLRSARAAAEGANAAQAVADAMKDTWAFEYRSPAADEKPLLDLRALNEPVAGAGGFIQRSADGGSFVHADGTPVRFFAVNGAFGGSGGGVDPAVSARFLAQRGVNLVRLGVSLAPKSDDAAITDINEKALDNAFKTVAALKAEGIYVMLTPYWAHGDFVGTIPASWGVVGPAGVHPRFGDLFFDPKLQEAYKNWVKALLTRENPYTHLPLGQDPAVALIQVQNEDGLFFWTMQNPSPGLLKLVRTAYKTYLVKEHGSLEKAYAAWGIGTPKDDDGLPPWAPTYDLTRAWTGPHAKQVEDETRFLAQHQYDFYKHMEAFMRDDCGAKPLINASNWRTADGSRLLDLERWTYTANEVIADNRYFDGGPLVGENRGWRIDPGYSFAKHSIMHNPDELTVAVRQVAGYPFVMTETLWVPPQDYQSEGLFLVSAYQRLLGLDAVCWNGVTDAEYGNLYFPWWQVQGQHPMMMWTVNTPMVAGQFPAAALLVRQGEVAQGKPAVTQERTLQTLFERVPADLVDGAAYDPNRDAQRPTDTAAQGSINPLAFLVGPVQVKFGDRDAQQVENLKSYIDTSDKVVRSNTGELAWHYGAGICTLNAPAAQGVTGFVGGHGPFKLGAVTIDCQNDYATVYVVSMDGRPLSDASRILVQVGTQAWPTGWATKPAQVPASGNANAKDAKLLPGQEITNVGKLPWRVVNTHASITLHNSQVTTATALDTAGRAAGTVAVTRQGADVQLKLPANAMYVVLQ